MRRPCRADIKTAVEALDGRIAAANDYYETQVLPRLQAHEDASGGSRRKNRRLEDARRQSDELG